MDATFARWFSFWFCLLLNALLPPISRSLVLLPRLGLFRPRIRHHQSHHESHPENHSESHVFCDDFSDSFSEDFEDCHADASSPGRRETLARMMASVAVAVPALPPGAVAVAPLSSPSSEAPKHGAPTSSLPERPSWDPELSRAAQRLYDLDHRLVPGKDYAVRVVRTASPAGNNVPTRLFDRVDPAVLEDRPTYRAFGALLDNYQPDVCLAEDNTRDETEEAYAFLRACMATPVMRYCYSYCRDRLKEVARQEQQQQQQELNLSPESGKKKKNSLPQNYSFDTEEDFVQLLYKIWFTLYSRSKGCGNGQQEDDGMDNNNNNNNNNKGPRERVFGSSGFEHVFVGEIRTGRVIGFHNWIQLYRQERAGSLDYLGTPIARSGDSGSEGTPRVLAYHLRWKGAEKPLGTSFLGVSPEFELALYTMVFLVGNARGDNRLRLDLDDASGTANHSTDINVRCFRTRGRVGSCYVEWPS